MFSLPLKRLAGILLACAAALVMRYLLPVLLPFVLALLLALAAEPLVQFLAQRLRLPRIAAAGIGVSTALAVLIGALVLLLAVLVRQLHTLTDVMPELVSAARDGLGALEGWTQTLVSRAPASIRPLVDRSTQVIFDSGEAVTEHLASGVVRFASSLVTQLPDSALGIGTWLLAGYMFSVRLPRLRQWSAARFGNIAAGFARLRTALFGWLKAQLKLMGITFSLLLGGFWLLRVPHAPVWALLICLLDMLPVLGTGTALIPWSAVCFVQSDTALGIGLLGLYAVTLLSRTVLEPKLVGRQLGLDPLVTLMVMYAGYCLWGLGGLLLAPLLAVALRQVLSCGDPDTPAA